METAQALALRAGVFSRDERAAQDHLAELVRAAGGHFKVGVIGARYLFEELSRAGYTDLAYRSIVHEEFPSYAYWLKKGATTLWEAFNLFKEEEGVFERADGGRMLSLNHHFWGSVSGWFFKTLGGIALVAHDRVAIAPHYCSGLTFCECGYESEAGKIFVRWKRENGFVMLKAENHGFQGTIDINGQQKTLAEGTNEYVWKE